MLRKKPILILFMTVLLAGLGFLVGNQPVAAQTETASQSIMDVLRGNAQLEDMETLVQAAALADNLDEDGPFTVFAPTDAAMAALDSTLDDSTVSLTDVLLYHVVNGRYTAAALANRGSLPTLMGDSLSISSSDGEILLNGTVRITTRDVTAANGVVHIVDAILLPAASGSRTDTLDAVLTADGRFTTLLALLDDAGLRDELANAGQTYTIFAPTDDAFAQLSEAEYDTLLGDAESLETILSYHLVGDRLEVNQIANDDYIPTVEGRPLFITTDDNGQVLVNDQPLTTFGMTGANGIIHVVDRVLTP
ncbi:MAG: fasciclin domain-containing protein [Anaerolineales bacterium]|nr:fasciclin domain-containing protein [Anaerolineales bacterium]